MDKQYRKVQINRGKNGWGGPLVIEPKEGKDIVCSVTGGGIDPVAQRIAELSGGKAVDGFRSGVPFEKICVVVINCGGTARVGVYPMKKVPTVDLIGTRPTGPLSRFITPDIFVSGVGVQDIVLLDD